MKANSWTHLYGARRRAIDKIILQEYEHRIEAEEKAAEPIPDAVNQATHRSAMGSSVDNDARLTIARVFGRPPS